MSRTNRSVRPVYGRKSLSFRGRYPARTTDRRNVGTARRSSGQPSGDWAGHPLLLLFVWTLIALIAIAFVAVDRAVSHVADAAEASQSSSTYSSPEYVGGEPKTH